MAPAAGTAAVPARRAHTLADKVHPALRPYLLPGAPDERVRVIVSFRDTLTIPDFPDVPERGGPRAGRDTSIRVHDLVVRAPDFLQPLIALRSADYDTLLDTLATVYRAEQRSPQWLIRAVTADVPTSQIVPLARWNQVIYIEPVRGGERPPQGDADSSAARGATGADPLIAGGYGGGLVALLDTGVRATHKLLQGAGNIHFRGDCVDGDANCGGPEASPGEACPTDVGHGTGAAAILTGNASMGDEYRGMTDVRIDSYRVYAKTEMEGMCGAELDADAASRAILVALAKGARVILVESQGTGSEYSSISLNADAAFAKGAVVMAPVGNYGAGAVGCPGNARGVLSVGAYDVSTGDWYSGQSYGPTSDDGRTKPEVVAPTGCTTASGAADDALTSLPKTSGAAPVATGVGVLLRNLLRGSATKVAPGYVYAAMIAATDTTAHGYEIEKHGAGRLEFPEEADVWNDWTDLTHGDIAEWELEDVDAKTLGVAIWWADPFVLDEAGYTMESHNDLNLELVKVDGDTETVVAESSRGPGVFERVAARVTAGKGKGVKWKIRITGHEIAAETKQRVYWVAIGKL